MKQKYKTKIQVIREKKVKIKDNQDRIQNMVENNKKLKQYKPPLTS